MASISPSSLQLSANPFPSSRARPLFNSHAQKPSTFTFTTRAADPETPAETETTKADPEDQFESRLSRIRYRSGTGKKAEVRKSKKGSMAKSASSSIYLPPIPLKEPVSGGLKVDFGFSPYSERINGRIAMLGLGALLAVELATGKGVVKYHSPAIVLVQIYFVAASFTLRMSTSMEEETKKTITLRSQDNVKFQVEEAVMLESHTIKLMVEDGCADGEIPLSNVTGAILSKLIEYCKYHADAKADDGAVKAWDAEFIKVDLDTLHDLMLAANYLDIPGLLDLTCQTVADMIKGKTPEQIRKLFNITNDFTPEEEDRIQNENPWAFE